MNKITKITFENIRIKLLKMTFVHKISFAKAINISMNYFITLLFLYNITTGQWESNLGI